MFDRLQRSGDFLLGYKWGRLQLEETKSDNKKLEWNSSLEWNCESKKMKLNLEKMG